MSRRVFLCPLISSSTDVTSIAMTCSSRSLPFSLLPHGHNVVSGTAHLDDTGTSLQMRNGSQKCKSHCTAIRETHQRRTDSKADSFHLTHGDGSMNRGVTWVVAVHLLQLMLWQRHCLAQQPLTQCCCLLFRVSLPWRAQYHKYLVLLLPVNPFFQHNQRSHPLNTLTTTNTL